MSSPCSLVAVSDTHSIRQPSLLRYLTTTAPRRTNLARLLQTVLAAQSWMKAYERSVRQGFTFNVMSWDHASRELRESASKFMPMNAFLGYLALKA